MAKAQTPRAAKAAPAPLLAPTIAAAQQAPAPNAGNTVFAAFVAAAQQQAPVAPVAPLAAPATPLALLPAVQAAVHAAQLAPQAANQAQAPASSAQVAAQVAHKVAGLPSGANGGAYSPGTVGAQIAAACNALQLASPGTRVTAAAVMAYMPHVVVKGVQTPINAQSASCGVSHWHKAHGTLRTKGQALAAAPVAPVALPTAHAVALQNQGFSALAAAGFVL